jgi:uncharacterized membrane protein YraQ (UPF0718 family)
MLKIGLIYLFIVAAIYLLLWQRDPQKIAQSFRIARNTLVKMLPMLLAIFGLIGLFQEFVPPELVYKYLNDSNGYMALLFGAIAGSISIGPPLAAYPLAETLIASGAWPPAIAAFILSWISVGIVTLPLEGSIFGYRFALLRNGISFLAAMLSGLLLGMLL